MRIESQRDMLPLRQSLSLLGPAAAGFARRGVLEWLSRPEKYRIASHSAGGLISAAGESALAEAGLVLQQVYGAHMALGQPFAHTYVDPCHGSLMEPVMFLRLDAPAVHARGLRERLQARHADLQELDVQRHRAVLRAVVRLADLLGFESEAARLTGGSVHVLSWLLRYEPFRARPASPPSACIAPAAR